MASVSGAGIPASHGTNGQFATPRILQACFAPRIDETGPVGGQSLSTLRMGGGFVEVPVTVKDAAGRLVENLPLNDFAVYEDGVPQKLSFFSSKSLPLSAAVIIDDSLPAAILDQVVAALPVLISGFRRSDEVAFYRYGASGEQIMPFARLDNRSFRTADRAKRIRELIQASESATSDKLGEHVLNSAVLGAALDLSRRDRGAWRRIILVIGEGQDYGSIVHYADVLRFLLSNGISVYGLGLETGTSPATPRLGDGSTLQKYADATGGDSFASFSEKSIEHSFLEITDQIHRQYTLGYMGQPRGGKDFRSIDVHVHHPNWGVTAKAGYYPSALGVAAQPAP